MTSSAVVTSSCTDESGELVVCFIHGTDITGGNSGSPVLDANGDLIGCV